MTKLDRLEEQMFYAIHGFGSMDGGYAADSETQRELEQQAKAAAQVALRWIEKTWDFQSKAMFSSDPAVAFKTFPEFLTENGLTSDPVKEEAVSAKNAPTAGIIDSKV